jgi:hypothetical protein
MWLMQEEERTIEMPPEWDGVIPSDVFLEEAARIVERAADEGFILRAMGGVAIRMQAPDHTGLASRLARLGEGNQEFTDLDFMAYRRDRERVKPLMESLGYTKRRATLSSAASERQIYFHDRGWFFVDVFFDKLLVANHPIDLRKRLELERPTLSVTDLLLEKLQIVNLGGKDLKDTILLLASHTVSVAGGDGNIDAGYVASVLSRDWGFWYTVTTNLTDLRQALPTLDPLTDSERQAIDVQVDALLDRIAAEPKPLRWKARARVGTRVRWYEPVETMETTSGFGIWRLREEPDTGDA